MNCASQITAIISASTKHTEILLSVDRKYVVRCWLWSGYIGIMAAPSLLNLNFSFIQLPRQHWNTNLRAITIYGVTTSRTKMEMLSQNGLLCVNSSECPTANGLLLSDRWKRGYNPDLIFAGLHIIKYVMYAYTLHSTPPYMCRIISVVQSQTVSYPCRYNLKKNELGIIL